MPTPNKRRQHTFWAIAALILSLFTPGPASSAENSQNLVTCTNLQSGQVRISRTGTCQVTKEFKAIWQGQQSDSRLNITSGIRTINICSNKASSAQSYHVIRSKCAKNQISTLYVRSASPPKKPVIA